MPAGTQELPRLNGCTPDGWSVPWALGSMIWQAGEDDHPAAWAVTEEDQGWRFMVPGAHPESLVTKVPGASLTECPQGVGSDLLLPREYLSFP